MVLEKVRYGKDLKKKKISNKQYGYELSKKIEDLEAIAKQKQEEYDKWKDMFETEAAGSATADSQREAEDMLPRFIARIKVAALREKRKREEQALQVAQEAQRIYRGRLGRKKALLRRQDLASRKMQRVYRGRVGRRRWKGNVTP